MGSIAVKSLFTALADAATSIPAAAPSSPAPVPAGTQPVPTFSIGADGVILQTLLVLAVVVFVAIIVVRFGVKRIVAGPEWSGGANLKVIERLTLEPRRSIVLVRAGERYLLLATSESGVSLVREIPQHEVVVPVSGASPLKSIWQRMTGTGGTASGGPRT